MNLKYLGDALDHWKGSLFHRLCNRNLLSDLHVDPMITNDTPWTEEELSIYVGLLNLGNSGKLVNSKSTFTEKRQDYFNSINHRGDLFLDPDTGIATGRPTRVHITIKEIDSLLMRNETRVIVVYQHNAQGMFMKDRVNQVVTNVTRDIIGSFMTSYESATVAMIFISKAKHRIVDIYNCHSELLGPVKADRVRIWTNN